MKIFDFLNKNDQVKYNKRIARLYKNIFNSPDGQEVLCDLIAHNFMLESTEGDLLKEGSRKTILRILSIIEYSPSKFNATMKEILNTTNIQDEDDDR